MWHVRQTEQKYVFLLSVCGAFYSQQTAHGKSYTEVNQQPNIAQRGTVDRNTMPSDHSAPGKMPRTNLRFLTLV